MSCTYKTTSWENVVFNLKKLAVNSKLKVLLSNSVQMEMSFVLATLEDKCVINWRVMI